MTADYELVIAGHQHRILREHLICSDGREAAAILLCRDALPVRRRLMVVDFILVPHLECADRRRDFISWPGTFLSDAVGRAEDDGLSIILIHSHPGGLLDFSATDDESDRLTIGNIFAGWSGAHPDAGHGSAVMIGTGQIRARLYGPEMTAMKVARIWVIGDTIEVWDDGVPLDRWPMAFGAGMTNELGRLHVAVIGVSGTGSLIAEQAARMGIGALTLIDFDRIEPKNLNRIVNSAREDSEQGANKVEIFAKAIRRYREDISITEVPQNIFTREAVLAAAKADVLFCCVDSALGRQIADLIAQAFFIPLIDMGVTIPTRRLPNGDAAVAEVLGRVDYVQPLGSTLGDRAVYTPSSLRAEYLADADPEAFAAERREGYIKGMPEEAPSVIALNMRAASAAMLELIARLFPFRHESNGLKARTLFRLAEGEEEYFDERHFEVGGAILAGRGATEPLLGMPALG